MVIRSELPAIPSEYIRPSVPSLPDDLLLLTLALPQVNETGLHASLMDVSNPHSVNYGRHLSKAEVEQFVAPRSESARMVYEWLGANNVKSISLSPAGDIIGLEIPVSHANDLLHADFVPYVHVSTGTIMTRTLSYSLPAHLHEHIEFIYPTTHFGHPYSRMSGSRRTTHRPRETGVASSCANTITPACLQKLYNIPTAPATASNNSLFVSAFGDEIASEEDLRSFLTQLRPDYTHGTFDVVALKFATSNEGKPGSEANVDIQYAVGLATNVSTTFIKAGSSGNAVLISDLFDMALFLFSLDELPSVFSNSYVFLETEDIKDIARKICSLYAQLGARGTSVIFSSGDSGVAGGFVQHQTCLDDREFMPTFPSTCPYVTSVGATEGINPEVAASFSSGGFSNFFSRPSYQDDVVSGYLTALGDTNAGLFNTTGRAFPDVSAYGRNYLFYIEGQTASEYGTSASTPTFSSIVALLNDRLLAAGKSRLGFLNPLLYSKGLDAFNDITSGSNPGCGTDGFPARHGWDPVTGLGTPDYNKFIAALGLDIPIEGGVQDKENGAPTGISSNWFGFAVPTLSLLLFLG